MSFNINITNQKFVHKWRQRFISIHICFIPLITNKIINIMSEAGDVENFESDNDNVELNGAESEEDAFNENLNAEPETNGGQEGHQSKLIKPKKIVRRPQPKLNADTLRGPKGLVALEAIFKNIKFKGPGHEGEDLIHLMKTYEYWCNRLFPKYPFDECISKIEKLGSKKIVQTYVKRIRLGMLDEDHNDNDIIEENEEITDKDGWDDIFNSLAKESSPSQIQQPLPDAPNSQPIHASKNEEVLSEELLERIKRNQERARKIREEKIKQKELHSGNFEEMENSNYKGHQPYSGTNVMNTEFVGTDSVMNEPEENANYVESSSNSGGLPSHDSDLNISEEQHENNSTLINTPATINSFSPHN